MPKKDLNQLAEKTVPIVCHVCGTSEKLTVTHEDHNNDANVAAHRAGWQSLAVKSLLSDDQSETASDISEHICPTCSTLIKEVPDQFRIAVRRLDPNRVVKPRAKRGSKTQAQDQGEDGGNGNTHNGHPALFGGGIGGDSGTSGNGPSSPFPEATVSRKNRKTPAATTA